MKLTKGKVPKLLGKKKQSLKRYKKGKKQGNKRRTFRKRSSSVDLSKKTLKNTRFRMKGGDDDGESKEQPGNNSGTMDQSLASLKEMTVGDLVSYLAQEIANKTLQTTLGPQVTEDALVKAAGIQSQAGEEEQQEEQRLADNQTPSLEDETMGVELTQEEQEEQAAKLAQEEQEQAAKLAQEEQIAKEEEAPKDQQTINVGEEEKSDLSPPVVVDDKNQEAATPVALESGVKSLEEQIAKEEEAPKDQQTINVGEEEKSDLSFPVVVDDKNQEAATPVALESGVKSLEEQPDNTIKSPL